MNRSRHLGVFTLAVAIGLTSSAPVRTQDANSRIEALRKYALEHAGDSTKGKAIFEGDKAKCASCHAIGGTKRKAGPDLLGIADKYDRTQLVKHVLEPNASIVAGYATTTFVMKSGEAVTGIIEKKGERLTRFFVVSGELREVPRTDVAQERVSVESLMPKGLVDELTEADFSDLASYLETLRDPNAYKLAGVASPKTIPRVEKPFRLEPLHDESLRFQHPIAFYAIPGTRDRFLVLENDPAKIWLLEGKGETMRKSLFLDMKNEAHTGQHMGLMGLAFHPRFEQNRKFYLDHHFKIGGDFGTFIIERRASPDARRDSGIPSRTLMRIDQSTILHTGGMVGFGPDDYLYIGTGDGGPQTDPEGHAQDLTLPLGKILRIDVDRKDPGLEYAIPSTNPFYGHPNPKVRQEIWAYGLRQAWRFSWDPLTKDLWVGDVGQVRFEEVTIVRGGENHGWNVYEGFLPMSDRYKTPHSRHVPPVVALGRNHGASVTGGYVYRGKRSPSYEGVYIFCDYESKKAWGLTQKNRELVKIREIGTTPDRIGSFGLDNDGEVYAVGYDKGMIYRIALEDSVFE